MAFRPDITLMSIKAASGGGGGSKGKNCTIQSIKDTTDETTGRTGHIVTFAWYNDDGSADTASMTVWDGESINTYDADSDGIIDNAERVNGHTVEADVPSDINDKVKARVDDDTESLVIFK